MSDEIKTLSGLEEGISEKILKDIQKSSDDKLEQFISERYSIEDNDDEEFKNKIFEAYSLIIDLLKEYLDLKEEYYNIIALWIIGTYFHNKFYSYPYLFLNAMKGSGKTRTLNLITALSKDGEVLNSLTEAVLFRTTGTLAIDEFEGMERKGQENLRELLNSAYKKGTKVKRMKKGKVLDTETGKFKEEMVVEEFNVYRPICLANIYGMETVLGDRCISLILEKSFTKSKVNLIEIFREENVVKKVKELLNWCSLCRCSCVGEISKVYKMWNNYTKYNNTNYTHYTNNTNYTNYTEVFKSINSMDLVGREIELCFPMCILGYIVSDDVFKQTTPILSNIFHAKREEDFVENYDISLIDFVSQLPQDFGKHLHSISKITQEFKEFLQINEEWLNNKWMGKALKRSEIIKEKRRKGRGIEIILNIEKAQQKIKKFK